MLDAKAAAQQAEEAEFHATQAQVALEEARREALLAKEAANVAWDKSMGVDAHFNGIFGVAP